MDQANLTTRFLKTCLERGERIAFVESGRQWTYARLHRAAIGLAAQIVRREPRPDAPIALLLPNSSAFAVSFFATLLARRVVMPVNPLLKPPEIAAQLADSGARVLLSISHFRPLLREVAAQSPLSEPVDVLYLDEIPQPPPLAFRLAALIFLLRRGPARARTVPPDSLAVLLYTSGSTGRPKGVMLSHANLLSNIEACLQALDVRPDDVFLSVLPFFHIFGLLTCLVLPLLCGFRFVPLPRFSADEVLRVIAEHRPTIVLLVPTMYRLLMLSDRCDRTDFSCVRVAVSGGSAMPPDLPEEFRRKTGVEILNGYGITETSPVIAVNRPAPGPARRGSVGPPLPGVEVRIAPLAGEEGGDKALGEIRVRGPNVMLGYYRQLEATAQAIDGEGWYHTRDLGRLDADGFLYVEGRADDLIIVAGENIHPADIEAVLQRHDAVREAAVVGMPDALRGQSIAAFVILNEGAVATAGELRAWCARHLSNVKVPHSFHFVDDLPRNFLGKVQKFKLAQDQRPASPEAPGAGA